MKRMMLDEWSVTRTVALAGVMTTMLLLGVVQAMAAEGSEEQASRGSHPPGGLGVVVAPEPEGLGVQVVTVVPNSSAAKIGLQNGDRILEVDGTEITSPNDLREMIHGKALGQRVTIVYARGEEVKMVEAPLGSLAPRSAPAGKARVPEEAPAEGSKAPGRPSGENRGKTAAKPQTPQKPSPSALKPQTPQEPSPSASKPRAWLGVLLQPVEGPGVAIDRVCPQSPAARAGLRPGEVILAIDGKPVDSPEAVIRSLMNVQPDGKIALTVARDEVERTVPVTLGDSSEAPACPVREGDFADIDMMLLQQRQEAEQHQRLEALCLRLYHEVQALRKEVAELKTEIAGKAAPNKNAEREAGRRPAISVGPISYERR